MLKCSYELNDIELFEYKLKTIKYIYKKNYSQEKKEEVLNFRKICKKLFNYKVTKNYINIHLLEEEIINTPLIIDPLWLLKKVEELKS